MKRMLFILATAMSLPFAEAGIRPFGAEERVAFLGDSITHGGGYVADLQVAWKVRHPESRPVFLNAGIGGDTAKRGFERIEADLVPMRPDRVVVMFGMNDVNTGRAYFEEWMVKLCDALDAKGWKVDLMTPTPYDEWNTNLTAKITKARQEPALGDCAAFVRELAAKRGYGLVELHDPLVRILKEHPERRYLGDRVHPGEPGDRVIASRILEAAGEGKVDPDTVVPKELVVARNRLLDVQQKRRTLAEYERMMRDYGVDLNDREAVFARLDKRLEGLRKAISAADAKWHEGRQNKFKNELYGRGAELEAQEEAARRAIGVILTLVCNVSEPAFPAREFSIVDYGATTNAKCTAAFDRAFAACAAAGGGRVVVPDGRWLTGGIRFRSNCDLHLAEGATVEFSDDLEDRLPAVHTSWEGVECLNWSPLVYAYDVTNVAITGRGTLAPKMDRWREWFARPPSHMAATELLYHWCSTNAPMAARDLTKVPGSQMRPHLIQFNRAKGVLLDGFRIRESPFWTIHLYHSENCIVRNLDVYAHGHNNDGVDVEMTKDVLIENCSFDQGDDGVVLKAGRNQDAWRLNRPTENVEVRNCRLVCGHTLLGIGSELSGGIRNVHMTDCTATTPYRLLFIKTNRRRGGFVENVTMENVTCENVWRVFGLETDVVYQWKRFPDYEIRLTPIDGITMRNIRCGTSPRLEPAFHIVGDARQKPRNLRFENVTLGEAEGEQFLVKNAENVEFVNVKLGVHAKPRSTADRVLDELRAWDLETDESWRRLTDRADYDNHRRQLADRMHQAFGPLPERTPLNAVTTGTVRKDGYRVEKVMFESRPHYHVTGHLFVPEAPDCKPPHQAVLIVCGHSEDGKLSDMYQYGAAECAKAGFATFIIDPVDQGERCQFGVHGKFTTTRGHNLAGPRAMLLGEEFAFWRIWDVMRAIDWLYARDDIRKDGVGVMGNSGGGTMTSWMRAVDDRVTASAAACYISTLRDVCEAIGPQDAEQQIYGELKIGLNHAGLQLVRDAPGLICCKWKDFFPIEGSRETLGVMKTVARQIGELHNWEMCDADGPHGWVPSTIAGSVLWMRAHLRGESGVLPLDLPALRALDAGKIADKGLNGRDDALVTPTGRVIDLPGEKTIYDLLDEKLAACERTRPRLEGEALAACVRKLAGIRLPVGAAKPDVPFDLYRPGRETAVPVLIVADCGRTNAAIVARAEAAKAAGSVAMVADVAGFGELGEARRGFYGSPRPEEGAAVMLSILGESMVGRRATDILACAAYLKALSGKPVTLVAARTAVIPAAHAFAADRATFGATEFAERPPSWADQLRGRGQIPYCDCVYGALRAYDWTDLP